MGLLRDCEIFAKLRTTFISSSTRNVSSLTGAELAQFYSIKEAQYEARRARGQAYCRTQHAGNFSRRIYQYLLYDKKACTFTTIFKYLINII